MRSLQRFAASTRFHGQRNRATAILDALRRDIHPQHDAFVFERLLQCRRNVRIFARQDAFAIVNNRHAAAEPPEHLPEFQPDVAAAEHQQMFRHRLQLHDRGVGQKRNRVQSREFAGSRDASRYR